ncbi:MAG: hypothetical protein ABJB85_01775 [Nitrososphaerota archaeon]
MPELWLNYGSADVVLDIKVENLNTLDNAKFKKLEEEVIDQQIASIPLENMKILALGKSKSIARIITLLLSHAKKKGISNVLPESLPKDHSSLSKNMEGNSLSISKQTAEYILERGNDSKTLFVSCTRVNPMFGFGGVPTIILREFLRDKMTEAYCSRITNLPSPGTRPAALDIAMDVCKNMNAMCIQVISTMAGIDSLFFGSVSEAFEESMRRMEYLMSDDYRNIHSMIIGADNDSDSHLTLSDSLNYLWNSVHILKNKGYGILIAENRKGLGSDALERLAEGRMSLEDSSSAKEYIEGLEHLTFINELKEKYHLGVLSSLPHYYLRSRFGFEPFSRSEVLLERLLDINGKNQKILVIPDPNLALFKHVGK